MTRYLLLLTLALPCVMPAASYIVFDQTTSLDTTELVLDGTTVVSALLRGSYQASGSGTPGDAGNAYPASYDDDSPTAETRHYFYFEIPAGTFTSAVLRLFVPANGVTAPQPFQYRVFDIESFPLDVISGFGGSAVFADLGTGMEYGSASIDAATAGTQLQIELSAAALDVINTLGVFGAGGALSTPPPPAPIPEPSTLLLAPVAIAAFGLFRRYK